MASYVTKEYQIRFQRPYPNNLVNRINRRDLRIFVIAVGSVLGHPLAVLLAIGALTHLAVLQILVSAWHTRHVPARAVAPLVHRERASVDTPGDVVFGAKGGHAIGPAVAVSSTGGPLAAQTVEPLESRSFRAAGEYK